MSKLRPFATKCAVALLAVQLFAAPVFAEVRSGSTAQFTLVGGKSFGIHYRGKHRVHKHFVAPKVYEKKVHKSVAKAKVHHAKPVKKHHRSKFKHSKKRYHRYYVPKKHAFRHQRSFRGVRYHRSHRGYGRYRIK